MTTRKTRQPHVLVSAASKHGSTREIAKHIATNLRERGLDVTVSDPAEVADLDSYDVVILGSAVYAGHWLQDAKKLADRIAQLGLLPPVWLFSSGPVGDPPKPDEQPVDVEEITQATAARAHRIFAGKIDKSKLGFGERAIMTAVRASEGDFREWGEITTWAEEIAAEVSASLVVASTSD